MEKEEHTDNEIDPKEEDIEYLDIKDDDVESVDYEKEEAEEDEEIDIYSTNETEKNENYNSSDYYETVYIVNKNDRITSNIMTRFEWSEIIGIRACHIQNGGPIYTEIGLLKDPYMIAIKELQDRKCPLKIIRKVGYNSEEHWSCNEMGFPVDVDNVY